MCAFGSDSPRPLPSIPALVLTVLGVVFMFAGAPPLARAGLSLRLQIALGTLLLALPTVVGLAVHAPARRAALGARLARRAVFLSALLGAALWLASLGLMEIQSVFWPPEPGYLDLFRRIHEALAPSGPLDALVSVGVIAALPGFCEELVVRGLLLPSLVDGLGRVPGLRSSSATIAVLLSAALFGAMHGDLYRLAFTFAVGVAFGALRLTAGSLWPSVTAHVTLNTLTFLVAPLVDDPSQAYSPEPLLGLACLVIGGAAAWPLFRALRPVAGGAGA
jgi:membrane protease YdiL (CAAX protease family)